jgi:4-amino-4-deoxy-L-arabinose transferase-like glycosyltransferase
MGRRRERAKQAKQDAPARPRRPSEPQAPLSRPALTVAAVLVIITAIPFALPGGAYPADVKQYWLHTGVGVAVGAALLALIPLDIAKHAGALLRRPSPVVFATIIATLTVVLSIVFALYAFERYSSTSDEIAQLWHAKMLVHGRLALPVDPNPEFFAMDNVVDTGRWYSQYPIGGPAVLAVGMLLGAPWLVNPILAGIAGVALFHFARRAYGETEGRAIAALFSLTPMVLMMSGTYMNHVPVLCLAACALAALTEWERSRTRARAAVWAAVIGLLLGAMATIRPLDAIVAAIVIGGFQLSIVWPERTRAPELAAQVAGGLIGVAPLLYVNRATTGSALRFGYELMWGAGHQIGFHADPQGGVHTIGRGLQYAITYVRELNVYVMLWPVPALLIAVIGLISMRRTTRWDALLLALLAVQVGAYASYWYWGQFLGPRFLFTAVPAIIVLLARAPFLVGERYDGYPRRAMLLFTLGCVALTWTVSTSTFSVWGMARSIHNSRRVLKADLAGTVRKADIHHAVVFIREPFGSRLLHRLWALGFTRSEATQLLAKSDACSLLTAIREQEADTRTPRADKPAGVKRATALFAPSGTPVRTADPTVHISSTASMTPACRAEFDDDAKYGGGSFGQALPLEPIDADGRIDGDVIYAVDLGPRNEQLRIRFGDRIWYRLPVVRVGDRVPRPEIIPY